MKIIPYAIIVLFLMFTACASPQAGDRGNILDPYLPPDRTINGDIMIPDFTERFKQIVRKIQRNAKSNFAWYINYVISNQADKPLPYDPNLGISLSEHMYILKWRSKKVLTKIGSIRLRVMADRNGLVTFKGTNTMPLTGLSIDTLKLVVTTPEASLIYFYRHKEPGGSPVPPWSGLLWSNKEREQWVHGEITFEPEADNKAEFLFSIGKVDNNAQGIINYAVKRPPESKKNSVNYYIVYPLINK